MSVDNTIAMVTIMRPHIIYDDAGAILAVCTHHELAARIDQLLERHGITDTPDDTSDIDET